MGGVTETWPRAELSTFNELSQQLEALRWLPSVVLRTQRSLSFLRFAHFF